MGLLKGNKLSGLIGPLVVRDSGRKGVSIVQVAPRQMKQSKGTKLAGKLFGLGSSLAGTIRDDLSYLIGKDYDPGMINRFNTPVKAVIRQCFDEKTRTFDFKEDSFQRLVGFEFNSKSLLIDSLLVRPTAILEGYILRLSIPEFQVPPDLKFPFGANTCKLMVVLSQIALRHDLHRNEMEQSIDIDWKQGTVPAAEFSFEVSPGCLCVIGIGLRYAYVHEHTLTPKNSKTFNPVNVCAAVITEGEFVAPPLRDEDGKNTPWRKIGKLGLLKDD